MFHWFLTIWSSRIAALFRQRYVRDPERDSKTARNSPSYIKPKMTSGGRSDPPLSHTLHSLHWHMILSQILKQPEKFPSYCILNLKWPAEIHPCLTRYRGSDPQIHSVPDSQSSQEQPPLHICPKMISGDGSDPPLYPYLLTHWP